MKDTQKPAGFNLPYSPVYQIENTYYISGHTGVDTLTGKASPDIVEQTMKLFDNISASLMQYGLNLDNIVKTTVFLTDMSDFAAMNKVYATYFNSPLPARSTVAVRELPRVADVPLKVEVEAIAVKSAG